MNFTLSLGHWKHEEILILSKLLNSIQTWIGVTSHPSECVKCKIVILYLYLAQLIVDIKCQYSGIVLSVRVQVRPSGNRSFAGKPEYFDWFTTLAILGRQLDFPGSISHFKIKFYFVSIPCSLNFSTIPPSWVIIVLKMSFFPNSKLPTLHG